ncbi:hypothetical protein DPMN_111083 [Dreissena polymorpha]|uniref:Uncharacterized protein n=1 Tax=Dreissena polymorpha TaxID=45954 RepID=A0A9D4KD70_DREPO|nr:hypothetical protein DPMN_111083 [Dreissena polymorpha]
MDMVEPLVEHEDLYDVNGRFQRCTIMNREQGSLRRCVVNLGSEYIQAMGNDFVNDWEHTLFPCDFNGMWEIDTLQPGQSYTYSFDYGNEGWLPLGTFMDKNNDPNVAFRNLVHDLPIGTAGHTQMNWHTGINHMHKMQAPPLCMKGEKILGPNGPLKICYNFEITYEATIEFNYDKNYHTIALQMGSWANVLSQPKQDQWDQVRKPTDQWHNSDPKYLEIPYTMAYIQGPTNEKVKPKNMSANRRSFLDTTLRVAQRRLRTVNPQFGSIKLPDATKIGGEYRTIPNEKLAKPVKKMCTVVGKDVTFTQEEDAAPLTNDRVGNISRVNMIRPTLNELAACREGIANVLRQTEDDEGNDGIDPRFDKYTDAGMTNDSKEAVQTILEKTNDDTGVEFIQDAEGTAIINTTGMPIKNMDATHVPLNIDITSKGIMIGQGLTHADTCGSDQSKANRSRHKYRNPKTGRWIYPYKAGTSRAEVNTFSNNPQRATIQAKTDALNMEMRKILTDSRVKPDVMFPVASVLQQDIEVKPRQDNKRKARVQKTAVIDKITTKTREEYYKNIDGKQTFDSAGDVASALLVATKIPDYFASNATQPTTYDQATSKIIEDTYDPSTREVSHKRFAGPEDIGFLPEKKRKIE